MSSWSAFAPQVPSQPRLITQDAQFALTSICPSCGRQVPLGTLYCLPCEDQSLDALPALYFDDSTGDWCYTADTGAVVALPNVSTCDGCSGPMPSRRFDAGADFGCCRACVQSGEETAREA